MNFAELPINLNEIIGQLASTKADVNELNILLTTAIPERDEVQAEADGSKEMVLGGLSDTLAKKEKVTAAGAEIIGLKG